jgi:hypothetical protein
LELKVFQIQKTALEILTTHPQKNREIKGSFENQELYSTGIIWWASLYTPDQYWMEPITCYQGFVCLVTTHITQSDKILCH